MVHARISGEYIHFALLYATDHIFLVLPINHLVTKDGEITTTQKLAIGTNPSVSNVNFLYSPFVVQKVTSHVNKKVLNMRHQSQTKFRCIFIGIPQHQKGCLIYRPSTQKIVSSHEVVFDNIFSSALAYTSCPYQEALVMLPAVSYVSYTTSSYEKNGDIITFAQFEEGILVEK